MTEIVVRVEGRPLQGSQLDLLAARPPRDLAAAARALARLRAEFGDAAVCRAQRLDAHLPEASFLWEPCREVSAARPRPAAEAVAVRRILSRSIPLPPRSRHAPDGWIPRPESGSVVRLIGPYVVSGGWWRRTICRHYHFAETLRGELLWVYLDRERRRWYLQGRVE